VGQASLPMLSKNIALKEFHIFRNTVTKILVQSLFIALPITILILVQRLSIIRLLFGSQQFPWSATLLTAKILAFLTPAIICQAIIQILIRSFYALHDTKTPFRISFVSLFFNIISSFCFIKFTNLGIIGLAISATIGNIIQLVGLLYCFVKAVDGFDWILTLKKVNKILLASLIMGFSTWASLKFLDLFILDTSRTLNLATVFSISSIFGIVVYSFVSKILKIEEFSEYQKYFFKFKDFVFRK
ncbi:MAG: lipid II flippase MurJ, partial [Candidatus Shapirobacteria bacterium]